MSGRAGCNESPGVRPAIPVLDDTYPGGMKTNPTNDLYTNVHSSFIQNGPRLEMVQVSIKKSTVNPSWCVPTTRHSVIQRTND